jgi:hypothetical protein
MFLRSAARNCVLCKAAGGRSAAAADPAAQQFAQAARPNTWRRPSGEGSE